MKNHTEFLFAHSAVRTLGKLRGSRWQVLVERVQALPATHPDALAFALMMVRLNGCVACDARRYRERGGCAQCSQFVLTTLSKESEVDLLVQFHAAQKEIAQSLQPVARAKQVA